MLRYFPRPFTGHLICIGPEAGKYGDEYLWCIPVSDAGEIMGVSTMPLNAEVVRTVVMAAKSLGLTPCRRRDPNALADTYEITEEGKITMKKVKIHSARTAFKADGSPDWHAIHKAIANVKEQEEAGHYKITGSANEKQNTDGSADLTFTIHRVPTDPKAPAADAPPL